MPSPSWCTLEPGHPMNSIADGDRYLRGHGWVHFGPFLEAGADEYADEPGTLHHVVQLFVEDGENSTDPSKPLDPAGQAIKAAVWLGTQPGQELSIDGPRSLLRKIERQG